MSVHVCVRHSDHAEMINVVFKAGERGVKIDVFLSALFTLSRRELAHITKVEVVPVSLAL